MLSALLISLLRLPFGGDGDGKDDDDKTVVDLQFSYLVHFRVVRSVSSMLMLILIVVSCWCLVILLILIHVCFLRPSGVSVAAF